SPSLLSISLSWPYWRTVSSRRYRACPPCSSYTTSDLSTREVSRSRISHISMATLLPSPPTPSPCFARSSLGRVEPPCCSSPLSLEGRGAGGEGGASAQTASAASNVQPPMKTDRRRSRSRSCSERRS